MKKLLGILVLGSMLVSTPVNSGPIGSGELTLSESIVKHWMLYIRGGLNQKNPMVFLVTTDGNGADFWYCDYAECRPGNSAIEIQACERYYKGKECKIFARRRTIKWKNNINKGNKKSRFNSKMSDPEVRAKLTELGFLGGTASASTFDSANPDLVEKLKGLKKLYDAGALTKEEFEKAKKKLLN